MTSSEPAPQQPVPPARLYFLLARDAPVGIIFRRGPSRYVQLIKWNLWDDTFEPGQWFKGRIYERRSDLSPDGKLLVYFASKQESKPVGTETWTAISRPPYLTALSFWFKGDAWSGGGLFENNSHLKLNDGGMPHKLAPASGEPEIKISSLKVGQGENDPIELLRLTRDGWKVTQEIKAGYSTMQSDAELAALDPTQKDVLIEAVRKERGKPKTRWTRRGYRDIENKGYRTAQPRIREKPLDKAGEIILRCKVYLLGFRHIEIFELVVDLPEPAPDLTEVQWAECDSSRQRVVFAKNGAIFTWSPGQAKPNLLADFNASKFEEVSTPDWAKSW